MNQKLIGATVFSALIGCAMIAWVNIGNDEQPRKADYCAEERNDLAMTKKTLRHCASVWWPELPPKQK